MILLIISLFILQTQIFAAIQSLQPHSQKQKAITTQLSQPQIVNPLTINIPTSVIAGKYDIPVCASLPLTGEISIIGKQILDGMNLFFKQMKFLPDYNFYIRLYPLDDGNNITKTRANIEQLKVKSPIFISFFGSNAFKAVEKYLKNNQLIAVFPIDGLEMWRNLNSKNTVFLRASYKDEITALTDYSIKILNKKKISVFYEASEWGEEILQSIKEIFKERDIQILESASYPQKTVNVSYAAKEIAKKAPDAILCIAQARPAYNFIQQIINKGLHKTTFLCLNRLFSIQSTLKKARGITIVTSSIIPDPFRSKLQIAKEYRANMKKYMPNKKRSPYSFEGYINAAILCECIKNTSFPLSAQKVMQTIENINKTNYPKFEGLNLNFDPKTRGLSQQVWINVGNRKEWKLWK